MAITITYNSTDFNYQKDAIVIFKQSIEQNNSKKIIIENDFVLILNNNQVVGINIFNYSNYFSLDEGYHLINNEAKDYLLKKFSNYLKEEDFESFYQIGKINKIENHPFNDKLRILQIEFNKTNLQIVTNVQTLNEGNKYLFAMNGAILANGNQIIESKIGNVLSQGMIVSFNSLGIKKNGLIEINNLNLYDEYVF